MAAATAADVSAVTNDSTGAARAADDGADGAGLPGGVACLGEARVQRAR